jgi:hypothetical protein
MWTVDGTRDNRRECGMRDKMDSAAERLMDKEYGTSQCAEGVTLQPWQGTRGQYVDSAAIKNEENVAQGDNVDIMDSAAMIWHERQYGKKARMWYEETMWTSWTVQP